LAIEVYKERAKTVRELIDEIRLLYVGSTNYDADALQKWNTSDTAAHITNLITQLENLSNWDLDMVKDIITSYCKQAPIKLPMILQPIRLALIGKTQSPSVFQLLCLLGKDVSLERLRSFVSVL
jgi:glutamyl-tRNA synthetase